MFTTKVKTLIGLGTGLLGTAAIVTPLCCGCSTTNNYDENDRIYNVGERQLQHVEGQYHSVVKSKVEKDGQHAGKTSEEIAKLVKDADERVTAQLANFREQKEKQNASFTQITDAIIDAASNEFGVSLSRNLDTSINWSEENAKIQKQYSNLLRDRMNKDGVLTRDQISAQLKSFETKFSALSVKLGAEYADPLRAQNELKAQIATCFDDINNDSALLAATTVNYQFFKGFNFQLKDKTTANETIYWDYLKNNKDTEFKGVFDVSPVGAENIKFTQWVNQNFVCVDTKTKAQIGFNFLDQTHPLIPDYRIIPIFKGFVEEPLTNEHAIQIDWTFIKTTNYEKAKTDPTLAIKVTGHSFAVKKVKTSQNEIDYVKDMVTLPDSDKYFNKYILPVTAKYEHDLIRREYLDKIEFSWNPNKEECHYEEFFGAIDPDKPGVSSTLNQEDLTKIGLGAKLKDGGKFVTLKELGEQNKTLPKENWNLLNNFLENCSLCASSKLVSDAQHIVDNYLFASFNNSNYSSNVSEAITKWTKVDDNNYQAVGFPISKELWESFSKTFEQCKTAVNQINKNLFAQSKLKAIVMQSMFYLFLTIDLGLFIASGVRAMSGGLSLQLAIVEGVMLCATAACAFCSHGFILVPSLRWYDNFEKIKNSPEFLNIKTDLQHDADTICKDEKSFRNAAWSEVRIVVKKYQHFSETEFAKKLVETFKEDFNMDKFQDDVIKKTDIFEIVNLSLFLLTLALVIIMAMMMINASSKADAAAAKAQKTQVTTVNRELIQNQGNGKWIEKVVTTNGDKTTTTYNAFFRLECGGTARISTNSVAEALKVFSDLARY